MQNLLFIFILVLIGCSSKKQSSNQSSEQCLELIKKTKIKAPKHIEYWGIYSNFQKEFNNNRYTLRIVKDHNNCQALIMDYLEDSKPQIWSYSNQFNCNLNQVALDSSLAFSNPFKNIAPFKRTFSFKGHILKDGVLKGAFIFESDNEWQKDSINVLNLRRAKIIDKEMAGFDWEVIQKMKLKARCYR